MTDSDKVQADYYVAPDGKDTNAGTIEAPFATPHRARDAIRELKKAAGEKGLQYPVTVMMRGGKYYLSETLVLSSADSGTQACPVTYTAYPGEKPILSGGRVIEGWKPYKGKILQCEIPGAKGGKWKSRQLLCNGKRMSRARWPKADPENLLYTGWAFIEGPAEEDSRTAFKYKQGAFRRHWAKPTEVEVNIFPGNGWNLRTAPIKGIDEEKCVISLASDEWNTGVYPWYIPFNLQPGNRFYLENALEELDRPGEWCFDSEEGILYFWPPGEQIEDCEVVVPALDCLIDIQGGSWLGISSWLEISGFIFTETLDGDNLHPQGVQGMGAMSLRGGIRDVGNAVRLKRATHCRIEGNHFRDVGGNAVYLEDYNERNVIQRNEISGAGANGICLGGSSLRHPIFNEVADNYIHHCGMLNKYIAGVTLGMSDGNFVSHNRIEHMPHHAVNLAQNPDGCNYIEYNEIRWVCQEIADTAAINCWMENTGRDDQRCGHVIRYNCIADVYGCEVIEGKAVRSQSFPTSGIYLDNHASNCLVCGNIIVRCNMAGILIHNGKNNIIENNIFVDCQVNVRFQDVVIVLEAWKDFKGYMRGNVFSHNICYQTLPEAYLFSLRVVCNEDRLVARSDKNLFFQPKNGLYRLEYKNRDTPEEKIFGSHDPEATGKAANRIDTLEKWQALGFDRHSLFEDPLFIDAEHDDYRLQPESPAFKLGFQSIAMTNIGLRNQSGQKEGRNK